VHSTFFFGIDLFLASDDQPFEEHVAVVTALLNAYIQAATVNPSAASAEERSLTDYVLAKSLSRMYEWMDTRYSKDLFEALHMVCSRDVRRSTIPFAKKLGKSQLNRDARFLQTIHSHPVQRYLRSLKMSTPNLLALSSSQEPRTVTFYTEKTALEIHRFLCHTLRDMHNSVAMIYFTKY
jgi:hypothetical protein